MKINRLNLIQDMNKVLPGIATGTITLENADTVVFNNGHLYSYNSAISVDVTAQEPSELKGVVKGIDFYNCLNKLPSDEIDVEITQEVWIISDGKIKLKIKLLPEGNLFERFNSLKPGDQWIEIDSEDFLKSLRICNMPKNTSRYSGIYFKDNSVLSTDSYTINLVSSKNNYPACWVNNSAVAELLKWESFTNLQLNKSWLQMKSSDGTVFSVRTLDLEKFPYERVMEVFQAGIDTEPVMNSKFTDEFYQAVERASLLSGEDEGHQIVKLNIGSTGSVVSSERISGSYEESISEIVSSTPIVLKLDIQTIADCVKYFSDFSVIIRGENKNIVLKADNSTKIIATIQ